MLKLIGSTIFDFSLSDAGILWSSGSWWWQSAWIWS